MSEDTSGSEKDIKEALAMEVEGFEKGEETPPSLEFLDKYFPNKDSFGEKTRYRSGNTPMFVSKGLRYADECEDVIGGKLGEKVRDEVCKWVVDYEKRLPSIHGKSREEYRKILEAFLSGVRQAKDNPDKVSGLAKKLFTTKGDKNE